MRNFKRSIAGVLDNPWFQALIIGVILVNVAGLMLETMELVAARYEGLLQSIEKWSMVVFTGEYLLRMWTCTADPRFARPVTGRFRFAFTPFMIIDFIAIVPFYMPFLGVDMRVLRLARIFRIFRLGKLVRYSQAIQTLISVLRSKLPELSTIVFILLLLVLFSATMMYYAEHDIQPRAFSSIPAAMWWAVVTLASVGYGDIVPVTPVGKMIASVIALLGIGMFALPAGILGAAFTEAMQEGKESKKCPHCGRKLK